MDKVYKINHLVLNNTKTQFCMAYNDGIKNFSTDDFKLKYSSGLIGNISLVALFHELNMAIFVGSESNEQYNSKKLVIYDLINQKNIYSTSFLNDILSLKTVDKYLIVGFKFELKIFSLEKSDTILPINEIPLPNYEVYEIWGKSTNEIIPITKLFLVYFSEKKIYFSSYKGIELKLENEFDIKSPISKIQNFFYIEKINQLFIPDETAYYIYSINPDDGKEMQCLYRGKNPGYITSMTLLNKNYLAVNNLNRTIHIFDLNENNNTYNLGNMIGGFIYGSYISPIIRIPYDKIIKNDEGKFYDLDFQKKGAILISEDDGIEIKVIAYNGCAYKIKVSFLKKDFDVTSREQYCMYQFGENNEHGSNEEEVSIYSSYNSIFDKEKKEKKENKYVVII